jgi:hypothetical protein
MVNVYKQDGKILLVSGKVATSESCCCGFSCPNKTCSDLPNSFSANIIFKNYLTQYQIQHVNQLPNTLTFTRSGTGDRLWLAFDTATAAGCPNIDIIFIIYCQNVGGQPSLLDYDLILSCNGFEVYTPTDLGVSTDTGESLTSDTNCNLIIPTFSINFITPLTFLGDLFLNVVVGDGCKD